MKIPDISVVIPAYNAEESLTRAVLSVVRQDLSSIEVIIVDNNSVDNTVGVAKQLIGDYPGMIRLVQEEKQGPSAARNAGICLARAEWLQFLDADDYLLPGKLIRQLAMANQDVDWIIGTGVPVKNGKPGAPFQLERDPWKGLALCRGVGDTNSNLFRKSALIEVGAYDEFQLVSEDYDLYFRLLLVGKTYLKDIEPGSHYVQHRGYRGSGRGVADRFLGRLPFTMKVVEYLKQHEPAYYEEEKAFYQAAMLAGIRMMMTGDYAKGKAQYSILFPTGVEWSKMVTDVLPGYQWLYPYLTFPVIEGLRVIVSRIKNRI